MAALPAAPAAGRSAPGRPARVAPARTGASRPDDVRRGNLARLLRLVHEHGALTRSELGALTGLNRSTVRALTAELGGLGLVRETAPQAHGAGRPSIVVTPESAQVYALALDIGVEHLIAARVGLAGVMLDRREVRQSRADHPVAAMLPRIRDLLAEVAAGAPPDARCVGVGVGVCGVVRPADGTVRFAPNLDWVDVPLGRLLGEEAGGLPVTVRNEADVGARAEHVRGVAREVSDVVYLSGAVGVGGGVILDGRAVTGAGGYAGEVGHMGVNPRGRHCRCGRRGCWETEIGEDAVLRATGAPPGTGLADVLLAHAAGAAWTRSGIRRVGRWLGVGVVNLVNIFNPEMIVFGGATRGLYPATASVIRDALDTALAAPRAQVLLTLPALGEDSVVLGAAELALDRLLEDPLAAAGQHRGPPAALVRRSRTPPPRRPATGRATGKPGPDPYAPAAPHSHQSPQPQPR